MRLVQFNLSINKRKIAHAILLKDKAHYIVLYSTHSNTKAHNL